jgi:KDO2-lipid IV(A) lauroyltransferase
MLRAVGLVADQSPVKNAEKHWVKFLNQDTAFQKGADRLAKMTKYPVVFLGLRRVKRGYYEVSIEKIADPPYDKQSTQILDIYVQKSEQLIRENPSAWLWSHRRWKLKKSVYA